MTAHTRWHFVLRHISTGAWATLTRFADVRDALEVLATVLVLAGGAPLTLMSLSEGVPAWVFVPCTALAWLTLALLSAHDENLRDRAEWNREQTRLKDRIAEKDAEIGRIDQHRVQLDREASSVHGQLQDVRHTRDDAVKERDRAHMALDLVRDQPARAESCFKTALSAARKKGHELVNATPTNLQSLLTWTQRVQRLGEQALSRKSRLADDLRRSAETNTDRIFQARPYALTTDDLRRDAEGLLHCLSELDAQASSEDLNASFDGTGVADWDAP
ncbi:MAG: hypothetical protein K8T90_08950 [Planctomycetes bacterium]|nr:hypothetical protein [Planctomycetota bacterium]